MRLFRRTEDTGLGRGNRNPRGIGLLKLLREDYETHDSSVLEPGFWAVAVHRLGNARMDIAPRMLRMPCSAAYKAAYLAVLWGWGIKLDYTVELGRRVRIWHHGGMVLGARKIGSDVHIRQNTTFGLVRRGDRGDKPTIGDGVDIGCGVAILGPVHVGDGSIIGANTVVVRDVPEQTVVVGAGVRAWPRRSSPTLEFPQACDASALPVASELPDLSSGALARARPSPLTPQKAGLA